MKIKAFFINNKKYISQRTLLMLIIYIIGICAGAIYCTLIASQFDDSLNNYLLNFFSKIRNELPYIDTLKSSLFKNIRIFFILFISSHFRLGPFVIMSTVGTRGFVAGFTSGVFVKYYSIKGLLLSMSSLFSSLLFLPMFLFFSSASFIMATDRKTTDSLQKKKYILLAIFTLTIFCASSVIDSYITTTFMKLIASLFTNL